MGQRWVEAGRVHQRGGQPPSLTRESLARWGGSYLRGAYSTPDLEQEGSILLLIQLTRKMRLSELKEWAQGHMSVSGGASIMLLCSTRRAAWAKEPGALEEKGGVQKGTPGQANSRSKGRGV